MTQLGFSFLAFEKSFQKLTFSGRLSGRQPQPADVQELIDKGSRVVVLSRGMQLRLQTCPETLQLLQDRGIRVHVEETKAAAKLYNDLAETELVGGLFHSTC